MLSHSKMSNMLRSRYKWRHHKLYFCNNPTQLSHLQEFHSHRNTCRKMIRLYRYSARIRHSNGSRQYTHRYLYSWSHHLRNQYRRCNYIPNRYLMQRSKYSDNSKITSKIIKQIWEEPSETNKFFKNINFLYPWVSGILQMQTWLNHYSQLRISIVKENIFKHRNRSEFCIKN